jgi:hypothetical protein
VKASTFKRTHPGVIVAWMDYAHAYESLDDLENPSGDPATVGYAIQWAESEAIATRARGVYLDALVKVGILRPDETIPDPNLLWESHPVNLRAELDNPA